MHCQNALEINNDKFWIYGLYDNIYVNKCCHLGQDGIFSCDNVTLVIPIRIEENLSATSVISTSPYSLIHADSSCKDI